MVEFTGRRNSVILNILMQPWEVDKAIRTGLHNRSEKEKRNRESVAFKPVIM